MTKPARLLSLACLVTACWIASGSRADACTCGMPETLEVRDRSFAVFEGTVIDRRITLVSQGLLFKFPYPEQEIVVGRVWKGVTTDRVVALYTNGGMCSSDVPVGMTALFFLRQEDGRLTYHLCSPNQEITHAAEAIAKLGPPIATFGDGASLAIATPKTLPLSRRLRAYVVLGIAYYRNGSFLFLLPPLQWDHALLLCVLLLQVVCAIVSVTQKRRRRGLLLFATATMTLIVLLLWTGHRLTTAHGWSDLLSWA